MDKKIIIIIIGAILLLLIFFPKHYAQSGGFAGMPKSAECSCIGYEFDYYPAGCNDCFTDYYCAGIPLSCMENNKN